MSSFLHSIRWRIQAWHGVILLGALTAFCLTAYHFAYDHQLRRVDRDIQEDERALIRTLVEAVRRDSPGSDPFEKIDVLLRSHAITLPDAVAARFESVAYFAIFDSDGRSLLRSDNAPDGLAAKAPPGPPEEARTRGRLREIIHGSPSGVTSIVGRDITREIEEMRRFAWILAGSGAGVWLLGLLGGWWLAGRAIKPIDAISRAAARIAEGNLAERIDTTGRDSELDQLARVLNQTFERLHESFKRQERFTADASHELRTPVTILLAETQRILKRDRSPAEYQDALRTCHDTAERMRRLIEALLLMARQETAAAQAARETCDLADILRDAVAQLHPLADARGVVLETSLQSAPCRADRASLAILAANLVGNAIQHHRAGAADASVRITAGYDDGQVFFSVADNGPGIPAEDHPHLFERFYRVDKARTGDSGHTGLGLAIAQTIARNHGGSIKLHSAPGEGATFTVTLPAA